MPLINPTPVVQQQQYWINPDGQPHKISRWPKSGSLRTDCRYRRLHESFHYPLATRYLVNLTATNTSPPGPPTPVDQWGWLDMDGGSGAIYQGATDDAPFTLRCELDITHQQNLPASGFPGILMLAIWHNEHGSFQTNYEYRDDSPQRFQVPVNTISLPPTDRSETAPGFQWTNRNAEVFAVSECYDFPTDPLLIPGFALFNGVDARIELDHNIPLNSGPFSIEADLFVRDASNMIVVAIDDNNGIVGNEDQDVRYSTFNEPSSWTPPIQQWFNWRLEFEWSSGLQLRYELFIDDQSIQGWTRSRFTRDWNMLGVRNWNSSPTFADLNMKNLKFQRGTFASPIVKLDMPLQENALDLGPDANHGTTFNMPLPSV